jgi:hypothetical protein
MKFARERISTNQATRKESRAVIDIRAIARKSTRDRKEFKQEKLGGEVELKAALHERLNAESSVLTSIIRYSSVKES